MEGRTRLVAVSTALLVLWVVGTVVAVANGWTAEFGSPGDPDDVAGEWVSRGTLISAPLAPMAAQGIFTIMVFGRWRWWGVAGAAGLAVLGIVYVIGGLGEPIDPARSDPPAAVHAAFRVVGMLLSVALVLLAGWTIGSRGRAGRRH